MANVEYILWGLPAGSTDALDQTILYTHGKTQEELDRIKTLAAADGWHSFRVQVLNLSTPPDFVAAVLGRSK